jgi:predicted HicB family RNase H-like nuclease
LNQTAETALKEGTVMTGTLQIPITDSQDVLNSENGDRSQAILRRATELFQKTPDWVTFYREILSKDGLVHRLFAAQDLPVFEQTAEYGQVQQMLAKLRERKEDPNCEIEPTRVITVRLPKSLHETLKAEAHVRHTSMNKLCISKLLQMIDNELVPGD